MQPFLAVGDILINPSLLAYAVVEGDASELRLRLAFATPGATSRNEVRLAGDEARATLRWLRLNSTFLNQAAAFGIRGEAKAGTLARETGFDANGREHNRELCVSEGAAR